MGDANPIYQICLSVDGKDSFDAAVVVMRCGLMMEMPMEKIH